MDVAKEEWKSQDMKTALIFKGIKLWPETVIAASFPRLTFIALLSSNQSKSGKNFYSAELNFCFSFISDSRELAWCSRTEQGEKTMIKTWLWLIPVRHALRRRIKNYHRKLYEVEKNVNVNLRTFPQRLRKCDHIFNKLK